MSIKVHPSIVNAPMSRELYGLEMRRLYEHVLRERIPDDIRELVEKLK